MRLPVFRSALLAARSGQLDRCFRHRFFLRAAFLGQFLHDVPVAVPAAEVHPRIHAGRIAAQHGLGDAQRLDERLPIDGVEGPQAGDRVADRGLVGRLVLALRLLDHFDGLALLRKLLLDPIDRQVERRMESLDAGEQFGDKRRRHGRRGADKLGQLGDEQPGVLLDDADESPGPLHRQVVLTPPPGDSIAYAPQVFQQRQAEHDGDGPQLAQLQRLHALVGSYERGQVIGIHAPVGVRDQFQGQVVDAGEAPQRPAAQPGQCAAVKFGKMEAGRIDLLRNEIIVIQQPLGGRRDAMTAADGLGHDVVGIADDPFVFRQPVQQPLRTGVEIESRGSRPAPRRGFPVAPGQTARRQGWFGLGQRNAAAEPTPEAGGEATDLLESEPDRHGVTPPTTHPTKVSATETKTSPGIIGKTVEKGKAVRNGQPRNRPSGCAPGRHPPLSALVTTDSFFDPSDGRFDNV